MTAFTTRQVLERERARIMSAIRAKEPELARELESIDLALRTLGNRGNAGDYSHFKVAIDAIRNYLERTGHTATALSVAEAIVEAGWVSKKRNPVSNLLGSIEYHLNHLSLEKIRSFGGGNDTESTLIGLFEWEDGHP